MCTWYRDWPDPKGSDDVDVDVRAPVGFVKWSRGIAFSGGMLWSKEDPGLRETRFRLGAKKRLDWVLEQTFRAEQAARAQSGEQYVIKQRSNTQSV